VEIRRTLASELAAYASHLPEEPQAAVLASLALSEPTRSMLFFHDRVSWLALQLDRDPRTVLRRIGDAEKLLAEEITSELHRRRSRPPLKDKGPVREDWGEAPDVPVFFGRGREIARLEQWLVADRCRIVSLTGMKGSGKTRLSVRLGRGGIGKTDLSLQAARGIGDQFDYVVWRRLLNAPKATELVADLVAFLSGQEERLLPESTGERISRLLHYLRSARCLVVLDNLESILQGGDNAGSYLPGYEDYGELFTQLADIPHQSSFLLTSREKIPEVASRESKVGPVRTLEVKGLKGADSRRIFASIGTFSGSSEDWRQLAWQYNGNPLALELAARHIREVFQGSITAFLRDGTPIFADLQGLLDWHFSRLSERHLEVMYWLAINREPTSLAVLRDDIVGFTGKAEIASTLDSLQKLVPLERDAQGFTLQPVLMEYMTKRFVEWAATDLSTGSLSLLNSHALMKTSAAEYVREAQSALVLAPVAGRLLEAHGGVEGLAERIREILSQLRRGLLPHPGYAAGNMLNLLGHVEPEIVGYDFSHLAVWHAHLRDARLRDVDFSAAQFVKPAFIENFGIIFAVAFSPSGDVIAAGTSYGAVQLWSTADGALIASFGDHTDQVRAVAFSPDGKTLATGSEDQTIRLWETATGVCRRVLRGHEGRVWSVAFSPNGSTLATTSDDRTVRLWDMQTGTCTAVLRGHASWIRSVAFSPDGSTLATGCEDQTIRLWETATGVCRRVLRGHDGRVMSVAYSPDGRLILSGAQDGTARSWDADTGQPLTVLSGHNAHVWSVAVSPQERVAASGGAEQIIRIWDLKAGRCTLSLGGHTGSVYAVSFSPDGTMLASGGQDQTIRLWNARTGRCVRTLRSQTGSVYAVAFSPDGDLLASGNRDNSVQVWAFPSGQPTAALRGHGDWVRTVAFSPSGKTIASGSEDLTVRLWDVASHRCLSVLRGHTDLLRAVAFSPDGRVLASASEDLTVRLWDVTAGHCRRVLHGHEDRVWAVAFTSDGSLLISAADDRTIRVWDLVTLTCLRILNGHDDWVRTVAVSPDGKTIASGSQDRTVRLWDTQSGQCRNVLAGHGNWVRAVAVSPDGKTIASGSQDRTVRVWDARTGRLHTILQGHTDGIFALSFSPRDGTLASGSNDGTVRVWNPQTAECLAVLRSDRPYERMNIANASGLTEAQRTILKVLGAVES
jgi:WD40 repeat protein